MQSTRFDKVKRSKKSGQLISLQLVLKKNEFVGPTKRYFYYIQ